MKKERLQQSMQKYKGLWDYYEQLYGSKIGNLDEMDRVLDKLNLPRLKQKEKEIMNNPKQALKLKLWSKISPKAKAQEQMASQENSIKHLEKSLSF